MSKMRVITRNGDSTMTYDQPGSTHSIEEVRAEFDRLVKGIKDPTLPVEAQRPSHFAYTVSGEDAEVIRDFDETATQIVVRPIVAGG